MRADRVAELVGEPLARLDPVPGGDICRAYRGRLVAGGSVFVKTRDHAPAGFFAAEAAGLAALAAAAEEAGGAPVPQVRAVGSDVLVLEWMDAGPADAAAAERLGRGLALTHGAGAPAFGSLDGPGWIGTLPLPPGPWATWPAMWVEGRVLPFLRLAVAAGAIGPRDAADVEAAVGDLTRLPGADEPPRLLHGDLWSGNVLWAADGRPRLVDPAAQGGHRETDLAMLALFGCPHLQRLLAAYAEVASLSPGWRDRVALHQLHPVLVHAVLFGKSYGQQAGRLARQVLRLG